MASGEAEGRTLTMTPSRIHQYRENIAPDSDFLPGDIELLSEGNVCRLLDPRRTPGVIEKLFDDCAMFRWRITDFEHKGRHWDIPAEDVVNYQFSKDAARLDSDRVGSLRVAIWEFQEPVEIDAPEEATEESEAAVAAAGEEVTRWLRSESDFIRGRESLKLDSRVGPRSLCGDLTRYMASVGMEEIEERTADGIVLNPNSGEWIKGMEIVLAEMGLVRYQSKVTRTKDVFAGPGAKERRRGYLIHRLAFVRAYFSLLGLREVTLYRGISVEDTSTGTSGSGEDAGTGEEGLRARGDAGAENMRTGAERDRVKARGSLVSYTFNLKVARSFCHFDRDSGFKHSYLLKRTIPVGRLFMTYLETTAMNEDYKEAEALVLHEHDDDALC